MTAPPEQLVVMLYDGARRFLAQAAKLMRDGEDAAASERLRRAEAIVDELAATLDMSAGEIAERLLSIYAFCRRHLGDARAERDPDKIDAVSALLGELRESWAQITAS